MASCKKIKLTNSGDRARTSINDLPQQIIADILSRLCIELILTCKLVCTSWYSATKDPYFINLQFMRSRPRLLLLPVQRKEYNFPKDHIPLVDIHERITRQIPIYKMPFFEKTAFKGIRIKCSYNGLVCASSSNNKADPLVLANPITNEHITLPASNGTARCQLSSYTVGMGCDSSGRYKIVRHYRFRRRNKDSRLEILTLGDGSTWREIKVPSHQWEVYNVIFFAGVFFFFVTKKFRNPHDIYLVALVAIDFKTEAVQVILMPFMYYVPPRKFLELVEMEGLLAVVECDGSRMKAWIVYGRKIGEFYVRLRFKCNTAIEWGRKYYFRTVAKLDHESFLLSHNIWKRADNFRFTRFRPGVYPPCSKYEIPDLPYTFRTMWINPTFVSPMAAALGTWS